MPSAHHFLNVKCTRQISSQKGLLNRESFCKVRAPLSPHFTRMSTHQGSVPTELISYKSWDEEKNPPGSPAHPSSVIPNVLSLGLRKAGAPAAALEMERGRGISGARGTHLCGQGLCALGVAWAICLLQSLCQVSSCSQLPGVHLGWGKRALSPRLYQSQEMFQDGAQRGLCGVQVQASQVAERGQGSKVKGH